MAIRLPDKKSAYADWAIYYCQIGWSIIPLYSALPNGTCSCGHNCTSIGKHPRIPNGVKGASTDINIISSWWRQWPKANIGIATGHQSNLLIIDVDAKSNGLQALEALESQHGAITTLRVSTGGGGQHLYFNYPRQTVIGNKVNILPGIDIRSNGGYIVAPPSIHASGKGYAWRNDQIISDAPEWLLSQLTTKVQTPLKPTTHKVIEGGRNAFLASLAGSLRKHGICHKSLQNELQMLNQRICNPPLKDDEVAKISTSISKYSNKNWDPVIEFKSDTYDIPAMTEEMIPNRLRPWIQDISKRMQVPHEFIAAPAIVAISSLIGRKIGIYPKQNDNWLVMPNLWGALIARPGFFKSPAIAEAIKPLERIIAKENKLYESKIQSWEIDKSINDATVEATKDHLVKAIRKGHDVDIDHMRSKLKSLQEQISSGKPVPKRYKSNDATVEKIATLLLENPNGFMILRDELNGWLASLRKHGREGDREFYLESWNGYGSYTIDRIGRGTTHIPSLCLSLFGGLQPSKLETYILSNLEDEDDGLLQRFQILIYPEIDQKWINYDVSPDFKALKSVENLFESLTKTKSLKNTQGLHFSEKAQFIFNEWRQKLEEELRSGIHHNPSFESHLSKYRSLVPSLALIFHLIDAEELSDQQQVSASALTVAIKWEKFLRRHARKVYKVASNPQQEAAKALASKIQNKQVKDGDSIRSIYRHHWSHLHTPEKVSAALKTLEDMNWVRVESQTGTRNQSVRINPNL